jgi:peptidoglycan/LPS O-acetylase OafA/YrhL
MPQDQILTDTERKKSRVLPAYSLHLDFVRGLAALVVFYGHLHLIVYGHTNAATSLHKSDLTSHPADATGLGHAAVVVFFVLSGYLVGGSVLRDLRRNSFSWSKYALRRIARLWTVLVPVLVLGAIIDSLSLHFYSSTQIFTGGEFSRHITGFPGIGVFLHYLFFLQTITHFTPVAFGSNGALWSLSCEFWYYALFPLIAICLFSSRTSKTVRVGLGILAIIGLWFVGSRIALYFPLWCLGVIAYLIPPRVPQSWQKPVNLLLLLQFLAMLYVLRSIAIGALRADMVLAVSFTLFLYGILHLTGQARTSLYSRLAHGLSFPSYTLYASHIPIAIFLAAFTEATFPQFFTHRIVVTASLFVLVFLYAGIQYYLFERNTDYFRRHVESLLFRQRAKQREEAGASPVETYAK